jgi:predicted secreted hydrolase
MGWRSMGTLLAALAVAAAAAVVAVATVALGAVPDESLDALRPGAQGQGSFAVAAEPLTFEFPRDQGPHPEFRQEWWYLTGNLTSADGGTRAGERFGFELTIFRVALTPPTAVLPAGQSPWRAHQIYVAHFAVTDVSRNTFRFAQKFERDALGLAGAVADPFRVWLDDWQIGGAPHWTVQAQEKDYELKLEVQSLAPPILNGDHGLSVKANDPGAASYYYSIPRVGLRGELIRDRVPISVTGTAWLDREWGSGSLGSNEAGWDWFALQLDDGSALMFYSLRDKNGARDLHSAGTWVDSTGHAHALSNTDVEITVVDRWESPRGGRYPSHWRVSVPSLALDLDVRPVMANQELGTSPRYWEGAVDVGGTRSRTKVAGRGYVELVGYAGN